MDGLVRSSNEAKSGILVLMLIYAESIPDLTPLLKPTTLGDFATYFFASAGGLLLGGELGENSMC